MLPRKLHPVLAALIAYPLATWIVMAGMYIASRGHDPADDPDDRPGRNEIVVFVISPVVFPVLMLLAVLSNDAQQHRQLLEYGSAFVVAWAACWFLVRWLWTLLPSRRATTDDITSLHRQ